MVPRQVVASAAVFACVAVAVALYVAYPNSLVTLLPSPDMRELHVDFDTFRASAVALVQGGDIYHTPAKLRNLNPPLLTVLFAPSALLDALPAYRVFAVLTLLMVVGTVLVVARELRLSRAATAGSVLVVLASSPLHGTLLLGQIYGLLLVGLAAGWIAERRRHPLLAAALYGATVALKPSLAPLLLLPLALRRWRPAATGFAAAAGASLLGVLVAGPASGLEWLRIGLTEPTPDVADNASLPGLAVRLGLPSAVGTVVGLAVLGTTLALLHRRRADVDPSGTAPWAVLAAGLLMSPIAWHNYLMLLWPGVLALLAGEPRADAPRTPYRPEWAAVLLAAAVIPVSWNALWPAGVWWGVPGRALYSAILASYWWVLLSSADPGSSRWSCRWSSSRSRRSSAETSRTSRRSSAGSSRVVAGRSVPSRSSGSDTPRPAGNASS